MKIALFQTLATLALLSQVAPAQISISQPSAEVAASSAARPAATLGGQDFFASQSPGGPGGDFDWEVPAGQTMVFDTTLQVIVGGPDFRSSQRLVVVNGLLELDDLRVGEGAQLVFVGPNPMRIFATGTVEILGSVRVDGLDSPGVLDLNTPNQPQPGAAGMAGGGRGGTASPATSEPSARGGNGFGPLNTPDLGGQGGEAGWSTSNQSSGANRRGGGGGGGVFGPEQLDATDPALVDEAWIGLNAEPGFDGSASAYGAENPELFESPPNGGAIGSGPFRDTDPDNDFFGRRLDPVSGALVVGELPGPTAGSGGGAGGDASLVSNSSGIYPDPFTPFGDEKGGPGGGGAGHLTLFALGPIVFGEQGSVSARGGHGGPGENTNFVNRIGAGGGGGSGGHVILQSGTVIDFTRTDPGSLALIATGGQGAAGALDDGGANLLGETSPSQDACPPEVSDCPLGAVESAGGDGGPGVLQLHVSGGAASLLLPPGVSLAEIGAPRPVGPLLPFRFPGIQQLPAGSTAR